MLLPMAAGLEIYTVEALAQEGKLAEVQRAMVDRAVRSAAIARRAS